MLFRSRRNESVLCRGDIDSVQAVGGVFKFCRVYNDERITVIVNMGNAKYSYIAETLSTELYSGAVIDKGKAYSIPGNGFAIIKSM